MDIKDLPYAPGSTDGRVGELLTRITKEVKVIASDELELAREELQHSARTAAMDGAVIVLGGVVALFGFGLLCMVVVAALSGPIPPLWLRLLIMAGVYLVIGGVIAGMFAKRLRHDAVPSFQAPKQEARATIENVREGLRE